MSIVTEHVGDRIRLYRKHKRMSMDDLAGKINKSKATISKYEKGIIAIDIDTLNEIAQALDLSILQLTDFQPKRPQTTVMPKGIFNNSALYVYHYDGRINKLTRSFLQLFYDQNTGNNEATLYMDVKSFALFSRCKILYHGHIKTHDAATNLTFTNQANQVEQLMMIALNPFYDEDILFALLSGISGSPIAPCSLKCAISTHTLPEDDALIDSLRISRDELKMIKRYNMFTIQP